MVLATHTVIGAALGAVAYRPELAFGVGLISHFLLDAIPHWEYVVRSLAATPARPLQSRFEISGRSWIDFIKILADLGLGLVLTLLVWYWWLSAAPPALIIWGAIGALVPDALQFIYFRTRWSLLAPLQLFHAWFHAAGDLKGRPGWGVAAQVCLVAAVLWCSILLI